MRKENGFGFHRIDMRSEWRDSAYDEDGNCVECDICKAELKYDAIDGNWYCPNCEEIFERAEYFEYIGADPPGMECVCECLENYPFCKKFCGRFEIDPDDPMLD